MAKIQITESELRKIIKESVEAVLNETQDENGRKRPKKPVTLKGKTMERQRKVDSAINRGMNNFARNVAKDLNTAKNVAGQACDGLGYYAGRAASRVENGFKRGYAGNVNEMEEEGWDDVKKAAKDSMEKRQNRIKQKNGFYKKIGDKVKNAAKKTAKTFTDAQHRADSLANASRTSPDPMSRMGQALIDRNGYGLPGQF